MVLANSSYKGMRDVLSTIRDDNEVGHEGVSLSHTYL